MLFKIIIGPLQLVLLIRGTEGFAAFEDTADFEDRVDLAGIVGGSKRTRPCCFRRRRRGPRGRIKAAWHSKNRARSCKSIIPCSYDLSG